MDGQQIDRQTDKQPKTQCLCQILLAEA